MEVFVNTNPNKIKVESGSPVLIKILSNEARLALKIITGRQIDPDSKLSEELTWENRGLTDFLYRVGISPKKERSLSIGIGTNPALNGNDFKIKKGDRDSVGAVYKRPQDKDSNYPLILLHYHPAPLQAHSVDLSIDHLTEIPEDGVVDARPTGMLGVLYPTGIADLHWLDCYFLPHFEVVKAEGEVRIGFDFGYDNRIIQALLFPLIIWDRMKYGRDLRILENYLDGIGDFDIFTKENKQRLQQVEILCKRFGIIHYRAAINREDMTRRIGAIKLNRINT